MRFKTLALLLIGLCVTMEAAAQFHGRARIRSYSNYRSYLRADPVASGRKKPFQRFGIGLSYTSAPATFKYQVRDNLSDYDSLKSISSNGYGLGGLITFTVPVVRTGMKGLIGVHIGINYMTYIYPSEEKMVVKKSTQYYNGTYTYSGSGGGMMIGVPVGLDMISGGEASLNREDRISFSLGGGAISHAGGSRFQ